MKKNRITQKYIKKRLYVVVIVFIVVVLFRIFLTTSYPIIFRANLIKDGLHNTVIIKGLGFGSLDYSSTVFLNGKSLARDSIVTWTRFKIKVSIKNDLPLVNVVQLLIREKKSNKRLFSYYLQDNNRGEILIKGDQVLFDDIDTAININVKKNIVPYSPIELFASHNATYTNTLYIDSNTINIPAYLSEMTDTGYVLYLPEYLWYDNPSDAVLSIRSNNSSKVFPITLSRIYPEKKEKRSIEVSFRYQKKVDSLLFMIPLSSQYQKVKILNKDIVWDGTSSYLFLKEEPSMILVNIDYLITLKQDKITPVFYKNELPLRYLFNVLEPSDVEFLRKTFDGNQFSSGNSTFSNMNLPSVYDEPLARSVFSLDDNKEISSSHEVKTLYSVMYDYIFAVETNISRVPQRELSKLEIWHQIESLENIDKIQTLRSVLLAQQLRYQGLVARTIIGYNVSNSSSVSFGLNNVWVEVLSKNHGWVMIENGVFSLIRGDKISLLVLERYLHFKNNNSNPQVPVIDNIKNL